MRQHPGPDAVPSSSWPPVDTFGAARAPKSQALVAQSEGAGAALAGDEVQHRAMREIDGNAQGGGWGAVAGRGAGRESAALERRVRELLAEARARERNGAQRLAAEAARVHALEIMRMNGYTRLSAHGGGTHLHAQPVPAAAPAATKVSFGLPRPWPALAPGAGAEHAQRAQWQMQPAVISNTDGAAGVAAGNSTVPVKPGTALPSPHAGHALGQGSSDPAAFAAAYERVQSMLQAAHAGLVLLSSIVAALSAVRGLLKVVRLRWGTALEPACIAMLPSNRQRSTRVDSTGRLGDTERWVWVAGWWATAGNSSAGTGSGEGWSGRACMAMDSGAPTGNPATEAASGEAALTAGRAGDLRAALNLSAQADAGQGSLHGQQERERWNTDDAGPAPHSGGSVGSRAADWGAVSSAHREPSFRHREPSFGHQDGWMAQPQRRRYLGERDPKRGRWPRKRGGGMALAGVGPGTMCERSEIRGSMWGSTGDIPALISSASPDRFRRTHEVHARESVGLSRSRLGDSSESAWREEVFSGLAAAEAALDGAAPAVAGALGRAGLPPRWNAPQRRGGALAYDDPPFKQTGVAGSGKHCCAY
eukprot:jgi/Ulvmu1/5448/UM224_0003.1